MLFLVFQMFIPAMHVEQSGNINLTIKLERRDDMTRRIGRGGSGGGCNG